VSDEVAGADVRDRVLRRGARERWRMCSYGSECTLSAADCHLIANDDP
jgi:hypothetical protein